LKNFAIFDLGGTLYIFNKLARFINFKQAKPGDIIIVGDFAILILGYRKVDINV
jgi:hypothetical protein